MGADDIFDILIIGGGPAGSAAAAMSARLGLRTLLVDKAAFPRDKLCGGLFTGRARKRLYEIFGQDLPGNLAEERRSIAFHAGQRQLARLDDAPPMYLTMRSSLDAHLLELAGAHGATLCTGCRLDGIDLAGNAVTLASGARLRFRVLVGADGVNSAVARALFGRAFDPDTIGFALEREMAPLRDSEEARTVRVDFGAAEWGYGWSFPKSGSTTVGVGGMQRRNPGLPDLLKSYTEALCMSEGGRVKGHFLPFGDYRRRPGRGNVLLAGDAAGFVDPITGEGIAHALDSGRLAAIAAARAIREGREDDAASLYRASTRDLRAGLAIAGLLRPIVFSERMSGFFRGAFARSSRVRAAYLDLLAGDMEYPALLWLALRRFPGALARAVGDDGTNRSAGSARRR